MSSDEDPRKKRRRWWDDDLFAAEFEAVKQMIDELMERLTSDESPELFDSKTQEQLEEMMREIHKSPMVWGFSASIGPDGNINLSPFGNLDAEGTKPVIKKEREPLIELLDQDDAIIIIAEIPGVDEDDIDLTITETQVTIRVDTKRRKYAKTLDLPTQIQRDGAQVNYANGILEVKLLKQ